MSFSTTELILIPIISGLVGWGTNWLAVWMTFYPLDFRGRWPLGWQGIIPSRAERMARIVANRGVQRVGQLDEFLTLLRHEEFSKHLALNSRTRLEEGVQSVMQRVAPDLWNQLPPPIQLAVQARIHAQLISQADQLFDSLHGKIGDQITIEDIAVTATRADPTLVNRIFQRAGEVEFRLIIRAGLWMGLLLGLVIALLWQALPHWWVLPLGGLALGFITNWWALTIIFQPLRPIQIGPLRIQGIFLRRQHQVAAIWADMIAHEVLTHANILKTIMRSDHARLLREGITSRIAAQIHAALEQARAEWVGITPDLDTRKVADTGAVHVLQLVTEALEHEELPALRNDATASVICERMSNMPPEDFQDVLRPAFQEDEWKLIAVGAALGGLAGCLQYLMFSS